MRNIFGKGAPCEPVHEKGRNIINDQDFIIRETSVIPLTYRNWVLGRLV